MPQGTSPKRNRRLAGKRKRKFICLSASLFIPIVYILQNIILGYIIAPIFFLAPSASRFVMQVSDSLVIS